VSAIAQLPHGVTTAGTARLVLVGAPNVGKSALFGRLTGIYAVVSNYPGTSVEVSRGTLSMGERRVEVVDTPGMYSLLPVTEEERVARASLLDGGHTVIHVVDASHLERSLPLTLQLLSLGHPVVVACNLLDEARAAARAPDLALLSDRLGVPVVGTVATTGEGVDQLMAVALAAAPPVDGWALPEPFSSLVSRVGTGRLVAELALSGDAESERAARESEPVAWEEALAARDARWGGAEPFAVAVAVARRRMAVALLDGVLPAADGGAEGASPEAGRWGRRLDRLFLSPWTGFAVVALVLYLGFYKFVGGLGAGTAVDWLDRVAFGRVLGPAARAIAERVIPWPALRDLVTGPYGLLSLGVRYALAIVLPIVSAFFLVFALLEDSGYLPRLALLLDRALKRLGLSGRAVIPLVLGFGCNTMATLVTRTLESRRERLIATLLLALAIPCSAQLGVVLGILSVWPAAVVVWALVLVLVFLGVGRLAAILLPGEAPSFYLELPRLRWPQPVNVLRKTGTRVRWYVAEILPLFLLASVLLWAGDLTGLLERATGLLVPLVRLVGLPAGAAPAFLYGFFRRDFGAAGLYELARKGLLTPASLTTAAITITLFVPCIAQFLMMKKERGLRVAAGVLVVATVVAFAVGGLVGWLLRVVGGWA
jgi:ferrous iron transport protein B